MEGFDPRSGPAAPAPSPNAAWFLSKEAKPLRWLDAVKASEASTVKIVKTNCRACIANCGVLAHVKDGRVVKLEGNPEYLR